MEKRTKITYYLFFSFVLFSILHNALFLFLEFQEKISFFIGLFSFFAFLLYLVAGTIIHVKKGKPKDWWKIGFLGFIGLFGFIPQFGPIFFGFYFLFGFYGFKK